MAEAFCLFRSISQYPLAFIAQRQVHGSGHLFTDRRMPFDLLADGLDRRMIAQKAVGQRFVFAQQAQQQVLRLNVRRTELAGLVSGEKDYAPCFLCVPLEHMTLTQMLPVTSAGNIALSSQVRTPELSGKKPFCPDSASVTKGVQNAAPDKATICQNRQT